ncbi:Cytochrome c1 precursor [Oceanicola granulosus HTCC2516]|uniref:Cytochrome c1 n=1 Tax=Oceanicola granulosus (strain ATCC BAA-861 / DSM 15982 / KCTC 12143 / HTCC2516) TaxID=314256 RepID=Q2CK81_OCEGH|nr:cytochrome c1 [Oceanicola granulosus]EAR52908.1 Cytochrome c1 precursor [Oceanicola granulosus HTCC2516]
MLRKLTLSAAAALGFAALPGLASAAGGESLIHDYDFPFEGWFGSYDTFQLQRGLQIYTEVCASCHGLKYVSFRNLSDETGPALPEDQVRAYAANFFVADFDNNSQLMDSLTGEMRTLTPADRFPVNRTAAAPDLSLMAKARAGFHGPYGTGLSQLFNGMGGPEYIASLLAGYLEPPACAEGAEIDGYYNAVFAAGGYPDSCIDEEGHRMAPGSWIGMAPPLLGDDVTFEDGHEATVESQAQDVAAFLMWTAEPKLVARKQAGLTGVIFLTVLSVLLYLTNKRLWAPYKNKVKKAK